MATFIPEVKPEDFNNSYGEMKVYEALRSLGNQYTVFYSLSYIYSVHLMNPMPVCFSMIFSIVLYTIRTIS